jgi:hypothetical protein
MTEWSFGGNSCAGSGEGEACVESGGKRLKKCCGKWSLILARGELDLTSRRIVGEGPRLPAKGFVKVLPTLGEETYWSVYKDFMRTLPAEGRDRVATLSLKEKGGLGGVPGQILAVGNRRYLISILKYSGMPAHKVALFNAESQRIEWIGTAGRPGVRTGKALGRYALAVGISVAAGAAAGAAGSPIAYIFGPGSGSAAFNMTLGRDKSLLFVKDGESSDVTIFQNETGKVERVIPVKGHGHLWRPEEGDLVYHISASALTIFDASNDYSVREVQLDHQRFEISHIPGHFYLTTKDSLEVWDGLKGAKLSEFSTDKIPDDIRRNRTKDIGRRRVDRVAAQ